MKTSSAKAKGRRLAQYVRESLLKRFGILRDRDIAVTPSGVTGPDLGLSPLATDEIPYQFECKSHARFSIYKDFDQAIGHGNLEPALIIRGNRREALAIIRAEHFFDLLREKQQSENPV